MFSLQRPKPIPNSILFLYYWVIFKLKTGKVAKNENLNDEFLKHSPALLAIHIADVFNQISSYGFLQLSIIHLILKSGDQQNPTITVGHAQAKLSAAILKQITKLAELRKLHTKGSNKF
jgi:hypothetical protein